MVFFTLLALSAYSVATIVQPPVGPYGVTRSVKELVDSERKDLFEVGEDSRRLMLSVFEPTTPWKYCSKHTEPYMPPLSAATAEQLALPYGFPNGTVASVENIFCDAKGRVHGSNAPIIIFSHGLGTSRLIHSFQAISLASRGYVVVTVDHAQDAAIVEYPDGTVIRGFDITTNDEVATAVLARQQDISFVIDEVHKRGALSIGGDYHKRILVVGHSLGGATAAAAMMGDKRIQGGVNIDGDFQPPFADDDINCPFMLIGNENTTLLTNPSWSQMWPHLRSTRAAVNLKGATHTTFTDISFLATKLDLTTNVSSPPELEASLGSIDGERALDIVTSYITGFARFVTGWQSRPLAGKTGEAHPEVSVLGDDKQGRCK